MTTIRQAREGDFARVLAVWEESETHETATDDIEGLSTLVRRDPDALLVAEIGGVIVGTIIVGWDGWRGSIYRLAVIPQFRRKGVGGQLVAAARERLRARGARRLSAIVVSESEDALAFWAATGWEQQEHRARFVANE